MKYISFLLSLCLCASVFAQNPQTYFSKEEMTNLVNCLPAPPDSGSLEFANDILRYMWGKTMRQDAERAAEIEHDAIWNLDTLAVIFSVPFGLEISQEKTPEIYKAFTQGVGTIELVRIIPKAYYNRKRPYVMYNEHMLTTWEEDELRNEGSYPSGHTIRGWAAALVLAEINPAATAELFARAWRYGENRVITGAHWQSDVDVSRPAASIGYVQLQSSPAYREQMDRARAEFVYLVYGIVPDKKYKAIVKNLAR